MVTKRHITTTMASRARNAVPRPPSKGVTPIRDEAESNAGHNARPSTCAAVAVGECVTNSVDGWSGAVGQASLVLSMRQSKRLSSMEPSIADLPTSMPAAIRACRKGPPILQIHRISDRKPSK